MPWSLRRRSRPRSRMPSPSVPEAPACAEDRPRLRQAPTGRPPGRAASAPMWTTPRLRSLWTRGLVPEQAECEGDDADEDEGRQEAEPERDDRPDTGPLS